MTPFQRRYVSQVKRCEDLERKLRFFASECDKFELTLESAGDVEDFISKTYPEPVIAPASSVGFDDETIVSYQSSADPRKQTSVMFDNIESEFYDRVQSGPEVLDAESATVDSVASSVNLRTSFRDKPRKRLLEKLDARLDVYEKQLRELNELSERLTREYNEKVELQEILDKSRKCFMLDTPRLAAMQLEQNNEDDEDEEQLTTSLIEAEGGPSYDDIRFSSITGVVATDERSSFERIIFRATRGNCFVRFVNINDPITDPYTGFEVDKSVFIIFYQSLSIENKLKKICDAFSAHRYTLPDLSDIPAVEKLLSENNQDILDSRTVLNKNKDARFRLCKKLAQHTERWTWAVLQEKAIYHSLNMFKTDISGMLRGEGWVVKEKRPDVEDAIYKAHINMGSRSVVEKVAEPWPTAPTHFSTNKFTYAYQEFVNTYGIPRYREANPALFTAATFPFLFGVMYGDIGHGLFLFSVGLMLLWNEKKNDKAKLGEMTGGLHAGRYMLTMMGFFAVYAGFMYNDCFSLGLDLFGSKYRFVGQEENQVEEGEIADNIADYGTDQSVYPFGLDPIWKVTSNDLLFFNSFKMKLSVVFGIAQMTVGTMLKGVNAIYFGEALDFFFEFIPMVVFAFSLFVYMIFLIFLKWIINWNSRMLSATCLDPDGPTWGSDQYDFDWTVCDRTVGNGLCTPWGYSCTGTDDTATKCPLNYGGTGDGCQPPNLITTLINIALSPGAVDEPMYEGQANVQNILLLCALVSVPTLLFVKPLLLSRQHKHKSHAPAEYERVEDAPEDDDEYMEGEHGDGEEHSFGEMFIHQAIETIEFVLGMVSNTASYLRLWALSLAHSELAEVFWEKTMLTTLNINWFATYLGFGIFAGVTFGVLLMMDVLECFLHALRLHWVEFQNKFFKADGIKFAPYSFKRLIEDASASAAA